MQKLLICTDLDRTLLPAHATKFHAVEFLMSQLGFDYSNTVFAGDSGNDMPLLISPVPSVLVANAHETLSNSLRGKQKNKGIQTVCI